MSNRPRLALHVPQPASRPGEAASFDGIALSAAGEIGRPGSDTPESALRALPHALIRVLDDAGAALGEWDPRLAPDLLRRGLRAMMLTRIFDDRLFRAHRQGKTSFYMKSQGEEAIAAAMALAVAPGDMCFPTYRMLAWLMARDYPLADLVNQIFSNAADPLKGRQLPILYSARAHDFYSLSGNVGSRFGHAVGWAMASAYRGGDGIAIGMIGEGTTAEGDFHEALTFAGVYRAPVILAVTNNQYAISSHAGIATGDQPSFAAKALAYAVPGLRVDGNDFLAVWAATHWAAERARWNHGPTLIEFVTYRSSGHSTSDDPTRYRPADEAAHWPLGDPIERLRAHLIRIGEWDMARDTALTAELDAAVRAAVKAAESVGTLGKSKPDVAAMFTQVFKEPDWRVREQAGEMGLSL